MIRTDKEYRRALERLDDEDDRLKEQRARLKEMGLSGNELKRALDPVRSFRAELAEEVAFYERLQRGELGELRNLHGLGRTLVGLRIALGLTQRELAERLDVHVSQVSRDERNEYHGITVDRASRILDAFGVELTSAFEGRVRPRTSTTR